MFKTVYATNLRKTLLDKYGDRVVTIFRQQIQPWHPSSTLVHEAGYAVQKVEPAKFYDFSAALFDQQKDFFEKKVYELLEISDKPAEDGGLNSGNKVTDDVKVQVKANRLTGVHVTPTVVFDGVVNNEISSGWSEGQWEEWLEKNVK
jgi:protein-disulfide isomerase